MMILEVFILIVISVLVIAITIFVTYKTGRKYEDTLTKMDRYFAYFIVGFFAVIGFLWAIMEG